MNRCLLSMFIPGHDFGHYPSDALHCQLHLQAGPVLNVSQSTRMVAYDSVTHYFNLSVLHYPFNIAQLFISYH